MEELYRIYGELMVKLEILQNEIQVVKIKINKELNKPKEVKDVNTV